MHTDAGADAEAHGVAQPMGQLLDHFETQDLSGGTYYGADGAAYATDSDRPLGGGRGRVFINVMGALVSISLLAGAGVWSYRVVMRDVQGIPMVQAQEGPMRVASENPGGNIALNQGLAVNTVQSLGEAVPVPEALVLAPAPAGLQAEDKPRSALAAAMQAAAESAARAERLAQANAAQEAKTRQAASTASADATRAASAQGQEPQALGSQTAEPSTTATLASLTPDVIRKDPAAAAQLMMQGLTRGSKTKTTAAPREITRSSDDAGQPETVALQGDAGGAGAASAVDLSGMDDPDVASAIAAALGATQSLEEEVAETVRVAALAQAPGATGPGRSLRPAPRPAGRILRAAPVQAALRTEPAEVREVAVADIPVGARLVQLGAFDSAEDARAAWGRINGRFAALMEGKSRVVQEARSGGRTFYRLRATGFDELSQARRFCAALVAERADCIPVMAR